MEGIPAVIKGTFAARFGGDKANAKENDFTVENIPDLQGKVAIVTGGNVGLGRASCLELAKHNAHVYLAARSPERAEEAIKQIKEAVPDAQITFLEVDLGSLISVKSAVDTFTRSNDRLDILMNNAGIMAMPDGLTKEGYELQFGTNHVGHALLIKLLLPTLLKTAEQEGADVRIVNVSSEGHKMTPQGGIVFPELKTEMKSTSTWKRYGQSKLANILYTIGLSQHYPAIKSIAIHPGTVRTNLSLPFQKEHPWVANVLGPVLLRMLKTPEQGARTQLFAATDSAAKSGVYYTPVAKETALGPIPKDQKLVDELWEWTQSELKAQGFE